MNRRNFQLGSLLLVLALAVAACAPSVPVTGPTAAPTQPPAPTTAPTEAATPEVVVSDQDASDGTVTIDSVTAAAPSFVVIHIERDGAPGPVIGFAPVPEGTSSDVEVTIDVTQATSNLFAMLHVDAGTLGTYEFPGADVPVKEGNAVVMTPFTVTLPPPEPAVAVGDQPIVAGTVTMDMVSASEPSFLVIHIDSGGAPGPVIGFAPVPVGRNPGLEVPIDTAQATPSLFATLHVDAGTPGAYEFPGADVPVRVGDAVVMTPFALTVAEGSPVAVDQVDSTFNLPHLVVRAGTTLTWTNQDSLGHTVTAVSGAFDTTLSQGDSFSFTFDTPGTYAYYCKFHGQPDGRGMAGSINVVP